MNTLHQVEQDLSRVAARVLLELQSPRAAGSSSVSAALLQRIAHLLDQIGNATRALAAAAPPTSPSDSETETEEEGQVDEWEAVEGMTHITTGRKRAREDEGAGQPQQNLPARVARAVNDEHLQHLTRLFLECTNAADSLGQWEERKVTRNPLNRLLNLGTRAIGGMLKFLERGGVPTHEVAESFCEATAKVPVVLDRHMLHKSASHKWLTSATDNLGQIIAFAQNRPGLPAALTDPRLPSARIALLQERDRHGTEYLLKMNELVLQVEAQQGPQDVVEAIIQLSCDFMRDFRLKTRLEEIGAAPRSDEEWKMFSECASVLEEWTWKACKLSPRPKLPAHLLWLERKLRAFAKGNPNRVPPALHKASARITTLVGAKKQKCSK